MLALNGVKDETLESCSYLKIMYTNNETLPYLEYKKCFITINSSFSHDNQCGDDQCFNKDIKHFIIYTWMCFQNAWVIVE